MAICSCSKQYSPPFTKVSFTLYSTKSHLKLSSSNTTSIAHFTNSSSYYTCTTLQHDPLPILSSGILQQEIAELAPGCDTNKFPDVNGSELHAQRECWSYGVAQRRKRQRRKRKNGSDSKVAYEDESEKHAFVDKDGKSSVLSSKEEARFSWYLKERARIEAVRMKLLADKGVNELDSSEWAKAAGVSVQILDKILCNGKLSEERIINCYQRFVVSIASSYQGKGLSLKDLIQEGSIGLLCGAIKYDPEKGYKLSTYAYWWIRQAITKAIAKNSRMVRLPGSITVLMPKICNASNVLCRKLQRHPTYDEIAEAIELETSTVRIALQRHRSPISLDQPINNHCCLSLQDIIPGPDEITPEAMVRKDLVKPEIQKLLELLCEREAKVIRLYYGLNGDTPWSFEEIGKLFKLSRERIRQIKSSALSKLTQTRGIDDLKYFI